MDRTFTVVVTALLACCAASAFAQESHSVIDVADLIKSDMSPEKVAEAVESGSTTDE